MSSPYRTPSPCPEDRRNDMDKPLTTSTLKKLAATAALLVFWHAYIWFCSFFNWAHPFPFPIFLLLDGIVLVFLSVGLLVHLWGSPHQGW